MRITSPTEINCFTLSNIILFPIKKKKELKTCRIGYCWLQSKVEDYVDQEEIIKLEIRYADQENDYAIKLKIYWGSLQDL